MIGAGAIGSVVADELAAGRIPHANLAGVARRRGDGPAVAELIAKSDVMVEAAGAQALAEHGASILGTGCDLVVVSSGALTDDRLFEALRTAGPGRLILCGGAIGGIDMIRSASLMGSIERATITTTKKPEGLIQEHMDADERSRLLAITEAVTLFEGAARDLVTRFPASTNVAATLALAAGNWDVVTGRVRADPAIEQTSHVIEAEGAAGRYRFEMSNKPSPTNPRSSGVVAWSVVRALIDRCGSGWRFV